MAIGTGTAIALGLGAALGGAKAVGNKKASNRERAIRATTVENSPWTGMGDPGETKRPGAVDSILQGTISGAMLGQGIENASLNNLPVESPVQANSFLSNPVLENTSALGQDVLQNQMQQNPYMQQQSAWNGMFPGRVA